jgi:hypothetical protein
MYTADARILEARWLTPQAVCAACHALLARTEAALRDVTALRGPALGEAPGWFVCMCALVCVCVCLGLCM